MTVPALNMIDHAVVGPSPLAALDAVASEALSELKLANEQFINSVQGFDLQLRFRDGERVSKFSRERGQVLSYAYISATQSQLVAFPLASAHAANAEAMLGALTNRLTALSDGRLSAPIEQALSAASTSASRLRTSADQATEIATTMLDTGTKKRISNDSYYYESTGRRHEGYIGVHQDHRQESAAMFLKIEAPSDGTPRLLVGTPAFTEGAHDALLNLSALDDPLVRQLRSIGRSEAEAVTAQAAVRREQLLEALDNALDPLELT